MQAADGASSAGQGGERGRWAHSCHGIGHCGEITLLIDSLDAIDIRLVIAQVWPRIGNNRLESQRKSCGKKKGVTMETKKMGKEEE